jgi:adenylate kinase
MYLILLGAPGSGKGTQAAVIAEHTGWKHISTGDMLREAVTKGSELGRTARSYMDAGALVPDDLVIAMLLERIREPDAAGGFILDGFPRNLAQAEALDQALAKAGKAIDLAINIAVPDEELVKRLGRRWLCRQCGAIYDDNPRAIAGKCDRCSNNLYQRDDDRPETVRARLRDQKPPPDLISNYRRQRKLLEVDGLQPVKAVAAEILRAIGAVA